MARMRIGDMLVKAGLIDEMQLQAALSHQRHWGGKLGDILVDQGFLDETMLWLGLSRQLGVPLVSLPEIPFERELAALVPRDMCERLAIFPVARDDRTLTIATCDPNNIGALDEVAFRVGLKVKTVLAPQREVSWAIRHHYRGDPQPCPPPRQRRVLNVDPPAPQTAIAPEPPMVVEVRARDFSPTAPPRAATPIAEIASTAGRQLPTTEEQLHHANEVLLTLVELCIQRGVFTREELRARITSRGP